ncbi:hypothetical protein B0H12DRAFT_786488 [Mycena haematopus]|nr:hypothetical protein B0H12DRAFT_786488 [Mycena haematopus]
MAKGPRDTSPMPGGHRMSWRTCGMVLEPSRRAVDRHRQLETECILCGESVGHRRCGVESSLYRFRHGGYFIHGGFHTHSKFTHATRSLPDGSISFVKHNPRYLPIEFNEPDKSVDGSELEDSREEWLGIKPQSEFPSLQFLRNGRISAPKPRY